MNFLNDYEIGLSVTPVVLIILVMVLTWAYINFPTLRGKVNMTILVFFPIALLLQNFITLSQEYIYMITSTGVYRVGTILPLLATFCLISSIPISMAAYKKGGFHKLKNILENGLLSYLVFVLNVGLMLGVLVGLLSRSINLLVSVLFGALLIGLFLGSFIGWINEFRGFRPKH